MTSKLTDDELTETLRLATSGYPLPACVEGNLRQAFAELQERRKAEQDSEPKRNPVLAYADSYRDMAKQGVESVPIWSVITDLERNIALLYRHAQPAPKTEPEPIAWLNDAYLARGVVDGEAGSEDAGPGYIPVYREAGPQPAAIITFYRDGIEAAAKWIDQQREAYDSEHGWPDPDTGAFEFGNDAQRGYSSTLEELAEGIRALHPNAGNSPVITDRWIPVSEKLPERGDYLVSDGRDFDVQLFNGEQFIPGFVWEDKITHWMPLPATPQEVK